MKYLQRVTAQGHILCWEEPDLRPLWSTGHHGGLGAPPLLVLDVPNPSQTRDTLLVTAIQALFPHPTPATLPNPGAGRSTGFSGCSEGDPCVLPHLWSGLGLPFFLMLLAVVSLKCSRPTVTLVTCSGGRFTLEGKENKAMSENGSYLRMVPIFSHFPP